MGGFVTKGVELAGEALPGITRAMEEAVSKTPAGQLWASTIKNDAEPAMAKARQALLDGPVKAGTMPAEKVISSARDAVKQQTFGKNSVNLMGILKAVEQQGGKDGKLYARQLADYHNIYWAEEKPDWRNAATLKKAGLDKTISSKSAYIAPQKGEAYLKDLSRRTQLTMMSLPHSLQVGLNMVALDSHAAAGKAIAEYVRDPATARDFATKVGAMSFENTFEAMNAMNKKSSWTLLLDPLQKLFPVERRAGVAISAVWGKNSAMEAAENLFKSGGSSKQAQIQLKLLGLDDHAGILERHGQLTPEEVERAAFRGSSEVMGFRSGLETPAYWDKNMSWRIGSTYKQYGFRTANLHKNALIRAWHGEGMYGVIKQLTAYGTTFAVAGEIIKSAEGLLTWQNPWNEENQKRNLGSGILPPPIAEYISAVSMGMSLGMFDNALRAATSHRIMDYLTGPILRTPFAVANDMFAKDPRKNVGQLSEEAMRRRAQNVSTDLLRGSGYPGRLLGQRYQDKLKEVRKQEKQDSSTY